MTTETTWIDNKKLMAALWPKWQPTPEQGALLNEKWGQLKQDKLRECIRNDALKSIRNPNIPGIHKAYCAITGQEATQVAAQTEVQRTREAIKSCQPQTPEELAEWEAWAEAVLATATTDELKRVPERLGINPQTRRVLAIAVDWVRRNP